MNQKIGMSVLTVLGIIFIILKLVGSITWSWWWVLVPFWIIPLTGISLFLIGLIITYRQIK